MLLTYEDYQTEPLSLTFKEMVAMHKDMAEEIGSDADALELYEDLLAAAIKYAGIRSRWLLWGREEKAENDSLRTSLHNQTIIAFNQLARYLKMQKKAALWRDTLGDETGNPYSRKRIGDFACYLAFVESLHAR